MATLPRAEKIVYIDPANEVYAGLWSLWGGATFFLGLRVYCKCSRRNGLWYDDYVLILSWLILSVTDILLTIQYATGYANVKWTDTMSIMINLTGGGTLWGQSLSKTAVGITLLRLSDRTQTYILWFCIFTMNSYMIIKFFFIWARFCGKSNYDVWYRLQGVCLDYDAVERFKVGGNVYNIIMDFVFAAFPWWITWNLTMRRAEKIGLCAAMSLGMIVAITSLGRVIWRQDPIHNVHDKYYAWRNGMTNIWFSSEIAGTIIVQCIPVMRSFAITRKSSLAMDAERASPPPRRTGIKRFNAYHDDSIMAKTMATMTDDSEAVTLKGDSGEPAPVLLSRSKGSFSSSSDSESGIESGLDSEKVEPLATGPLSSHAWQKKDIKAAARGSAGPHPGSRMAALDFGFGPRQTGNESEAGLRPASPTNTR